MKTLKNIKDVYVKGGGGSGAAGRVNRKLGISGRKANQNKNQQRSIKMRLIGRAGNRARALNKTGRI